jgi:molybdopterin-guanine dinucleotide biosynthesis protein A
MDAVILAGGENKRLSVIKGFLEINGRRIIESNIKLLNGIFRRVVISTNTPDLYFSFGIPMVGDILKCRGPITGVLSTLIALEASEIFVTACDMPFIKPELIRYIVCKWGKEGDAVIPIFDNKPQPLLGIYSKRISESMEKSIKHGERSLKGFLERANVLYITEEEIRAIDPEGRSFVNINTMEDYEKVVSSQ